MTASWPSVNLNCRFKFVIVIRYRPAVNRNWKTSPGLIIISRSFLLGYRNFRLKILQRPTFEWKKRWQCPQNYEKKKSKFVTCIRIAFVSALKRPDKKEKKPKLFRNNFCNSFRKRYVRRHITSRATMYPGGRNAFDVFLRCWCFTWSLHRGWTLLHVCICVYTVFVGNNYWPLRTVHGNVTAIKVKSFFYVSVKTR